MILLKLPINQGIVALAEKKRKIEKLEEFTNPSLKS